MQALEGLKVADFTWIAAGPIAMSYLSQCGATIVRIESSTRPDGQRTFPPNKDGMPGINRGLVFASDNVNKYSITLNLKHPKGMEVAKKLIAWADIVAENFRPGQMEKWGLGYEDLKRINPGIIMFRSSALGQTGPHSKMGTTGITLQSMTGFTYITGWPDRDPSPPWGAYTDLTVPALSVGMILAAVDYRDRTGKGQCLDLAQQETSLHFLAPALLDYAVNNRIASRNGNSSAYAVPHGAYQCKGEDRWCTIAIQSDEEWQMFCRVVNENDWINSPKFKSFEVRKKNEEELNKLIEQWTLTYTAEEVVEILQKNNISSGVVESAEDLLNDPQLAERRLFRRLNHDEIGPVLHRGAAFQLSKTPWELTMPGPCLGQHTEYVCREFLGMSDSNFIEYLNEGAFE